MENNSIKNNYWKNRKDSIYLYAARQICRKFIVPASVLDVGSNGTPILEWQRDCAKRLVSVDQGKPYIAEGIESLKQDFLDYEENEKFDLVTCFQVLEHVPDPYVFSQKLLRLGKCLVVSVPYKWKAGRCEQHLHDPVDEEKMLIWFGREPDFSYISRELNNLRRLIHVYKS